MLIRPLPPHVRKKEIINFTKPARKERFDSLKLEGIAKAIYITDVKVGNQWAAYGDMAPKE